MLRKRYTVDDLPVSTKMYIFLVYLRLESSIQAKRVFLTSYLPIILENIFLLRTNYDKKLE